MMLDDDFKFFEDRKKVIVLVHDGFDETEYIAPVDLLMRAGAEVFTLSMTGDMTLHGAHGIHIEADALWSDKTDASAFDCVFLPGGGPNSKSLRDDERVINALKAAAAKGKLIAAICAAPIALERAGLTAGRRVTSYPGCLEKESVCRYETLPVVKDGNIITGRGAGCAIDFGLALVEALFSEKEMRKIAQSTMFPHL